MALTLEEVQMIVNQNVKDAETKAAILRDAQEVEEDKKAEKELGAKKSKYAYTVLVRSDNPAIKDALENTEAFISKTDESIDQASIPDRIKVASIEQNRNCKKKGKIATFAEYFRFIKSKHHKIEGAGVKNVTKEPVRILVLDKGEIDF